MRGWGIKDLRKEILQETSDLNIKKLIEDLEDFGEDRELIKEMLLNKGWFSNGEVKEDQ